MSKTTLEPELLHGAPLRYAPTNEFGVVFLFSHLCRRMQLHVESVQAGFPDCIARQRVGGKERRIRIEFEFRSSSFRAHGHPVDGCDWIVCWEHDWHDVPPNIKVVELRQYYGHGFNVWVAVGPPKEDWPVRGTYSFGKRVAKGDLILFYEASPNQWLRHLYTVSGGADSERPRGAGYLHKLRRVCTLDPPLRMKSLETRSLAVIKKAIFSQKHNRRITEHWWLLHEILIRRYPNLVAAFEPFSPSNV
jgi:hypothetical protein